MPSHFRTLQKVLMQIVQELCKRPGLNRTGFDMPTIFVPTLSNKTSRCVNQIEEVCKDVEKTINQTIQNTLNSLEVDCQKIAELVDRKLERDRYGYKGIAQHVSESLAGYHNLL